MGKEQGSKGSKANHNRHLRSRIAYLHRAATHLTLVSSSTNSSTPTPKPKNLTQLANELHRTPNRAIEPTRPSSSTPASSTGLPLLLLSHLRTVSHKGQIRLSHEMKHTICKRCNALLVPGTTCAARMENGSRGGKKAWADVLVIECGMCGAVKRFPVGSKRQAGKKAREGRERAAVEEPEGVEGGG